MKRVILPILFCTIYFVCGAVVAEAAPAPSNVSVHYKNPQSFTEARHSYGLHMRAVDAYLNPLKAYIARQAARIIAPNQRLDIEVTDVDLAGEYEPWRGPDLNDVRIVKDIYPPRIDLEFTLYGADGKVLRQGKRKLCDLAFLSHAVGIDSDSLRYEKALIDRWLRKGADEL